MKTKMKIARLIVIFLLTVIAVSTFAQTASQSTSQTVCVGNEPYRVELSSINGATYHWNITPGSSPADWQINVLPGAGNEITVDWNVPGSYTLSVYTSANGCDGPPVNVAVTVNPLLPVSVLIATSDPTTVCEGVAVNFTATVTNGGTNPTYQWYNGATPITGATNATYSYVGVVPGATITCQVISNAPCTSGVAVASNAISVTVNATLPLSVVIATSDPTTICAGAAVNFVTTVTNGGTNPTYQWYDGTTLITGATSATYVYTGVVPGANITCVVTASDACITNTPATSNSIPITVNPIPTTNPIWHN